MAFSTFTPTTLTIPSTGTTGSGTGEINVVTNPTASTDTSSWVATGLTASRDATGSPLDPVVPTGFSLSATATGQTFVSAALTVPTSLRNRKLKLEFAMSASTAGYKVDVLKSDGTTRFSLTTDVSGVSNLPALTGKYVTYFDMDAGSTVKVRFTSTAGSVGTPVVVKFTQVIVGPGIQPQGAVVGEWQSYTPSVSQGFGTLAATILNYQRIGTSVRVLGYIQTGTVAASEARLGLPSGLTGTAGGNVQVGRWWIDNGSANTRKTGIVLVSIGNGYIRFGSDDYATNSFPGTALNGNVVAPANGQFINVDFTIPIAEWAGSGTVQLAQNDVTYYYSSGNTWGTSNASATTSQGPGGVLGGTTTPAGAQFYYTFTPSSPIQVGAKPVLEISVDGIHWSTVPGQSSTINIESYRFDGTSNIGATAIQGSSGAITVLFGKYAFGTTGAWGGTWYWRVAVASPGAAVGFGIVQPGVSSGLVSAAGLPGNTTGNVVAAGYVGETKQVFNTSTISSSADTWTYINALSNITKGIWLIGYSAPISDTIGVTGVYGRVIKVTQNADTGDVANSFIYSLGPAAGTQVLSKQFVYYATADLTSIELRFKTAAAGAMIAGPNATTALTAEDSQTVFYAIRIA